MASHISEIVHLPDKWQAAVICLLHGGMHILLVREEPVPRIGAFMPIRP